MTTFTSEDRENSAPQLIKYRDAGMATYTYFWTINKKVVSPYFDSDDNKQRNGNMKTNQQLETEAILSMVENMKALEQQLADAKNRIDDLETVIANQRAVIKELQ
jgi:hypothetical protein